MTVVGVPTYSDWSLAAHLERVLALADAIESGGDTPFALVSGPPPAPLDENAEAEPKPSFGVTLVELGTTLVRSMSVAAASVAVAALVGGAALHVLPEPARPSVQSASSIPAPVAPAP